jgi:hypothetical protein
MVWAHIKLDTNDKEEIMPYLNRCSTINELPNELLSDHKIEEDRPNSSPILVSSNSIFEESEHSESSGQRLAESIKTDFCSKLDTIGEFDPYGASLVSLLSKIRPLSIRDSIPIT